MSIDPRTPVIIGAAQVARHPTADDDLEAGSDVIDLLADAVAGAAADTGTDAVDRVLGAIDLIAVVGGLWRYANPGALVADQLGIEAGGLLTTFGGNIPVHATAMLAERIAAGELDTVVLSGGECTLTRRLLRRHGSKPRRRPEPGAAEVERWGPPLEMGDETAIARGGEVPRNSYAILDSAIRAGRGETLDEARDRAAAICAGYAAVAAANPYAADRRGLTAAEIREPSPTNRMVSWPYTKAMCADNTVDQAGALILCASEVADRLGVADDRRVYPHLCVTSLDTTTLLERETIPRPPGLAAAGTALRELVGDVDAVDHVDLYSCFPSIVTLTHDALGITAERSTTVTGGLAFAGAPLNFAAGQALVAMVHALRSDPGGRGLVQGNGGHATKHAFGLYSTTPPPTPHAVHDLGAFGTPRPAAAPDHRGRGTILGATVEFDQGDPARAVAVVEYDDGSRSWANSHDPDVMAAICQRETVGDAVTVEAGVMRFSRPADRSR